MSSNQRTMRADVLVIGFGKGGKTAAAILARHGRRVVIVERSDQMYGGTCPNVGCVPTKALVHHSHQRRAEDPAQDWYERSVEKVRGLTAMLRGLNYDTLNGDDNITVITGQAAFLDPHTVGVDAGGERLTITAETILINTGSEPVVPDVPGLRGSPYTIVSHDLIHRTELPRHLAIVGGGYLGLEFASIYRAFGSRVTVFEATPRILRHEDDDVAEAAEAILRDDGVEIVTNARLVEVTDGENAATLTYDQDGRRSTMEADVVLAASGRAPITHGLGLEAAGVRTGRRGAIEVDKYLRTSRPHIFALGDVDGGPQFTYISLDDSRIVLDQLIGAGRRSTADRVVVPRTLFLTPPLATVGLTERQAREKGHQVKVAREAVADIAAMPRAYAVEQTRGLMKLVIDADTDQILGAAFLSPEAQETINTVALAMRHGITASELRDSIYTHPSFTEGLNEVVDSVVADDGPLDRPRTG
jgi:pyruvate/2-oxoglutarate dehydrogenase complex dihydrolipoamide dehydrogenase (E3) component